MKLLFMLILAFPPLVLAQKLVWSDEFNGFGGVNTSNWICDTGTSYPGGPPNWGTGEVEVMSCSNVFQSSGYLHIQALHTGTNPIRGWTSGRIETVRTDFQPPIGGKMAVEARIQLPNVTGSAAQGYWSAFWMLGAPYRGNYWNWPSVGEIDIMENINGRNEWVGALHCGTNPGGPCNEPSGLYRSVSGFSPSLQSTFHTYRMEFDKSVSPQQIRWYVDGVQHHIVYSSQVDATTWNNCMNHGFFILLNVAIGGSWPGNPTASTVSGASMLVDYVRVYYDGGSYQEASYDLYAANYYHTLAYYYGHYADRYSDLTYRYYAWLYTDGAVNSAWEAYVDSPSGSYTELYSYYSWYYLYYAGYYRYYVYLGYDYSNEAAAYAYNGQYYSGLASLYASYRY